MFNPIHFTKPPQDLFLNPATDGGLSLLSPVEYFWRPAPPAIIQGFPASAYAEINEKTAAYLTVTRRHKAFSQAVEFNSVPILLNQASFRQSFSLVQNKILLSGASGARLLDRFIWENEEAVVNSEELLFAYFAQCQSQNRGGGIPLGGDTLPDNLPIAIECRNTFNPYYFITETLAQLAVLADAGFQGDFCLHVPDQSETTHSVMRDFVAALFPDIVDRAHFVPAPKYYEQVLTTFDLSCAYFQFPFEITGSIAPLAPSDVMFRGHDAYRGSHAVLSMNAFHTSLVVLRNRALRAIDGHDFSYLPKRFFLGRNDRQNHMCDRVGQSNLLEMLQLFGFAFVILDDLTPLEQIAIMANAEMMVGYHGADFTNMLFAGQQSYVLEIGTLQTATLRWGDFRSLAHAASCRYISFFADFNKPNPQISPSVEGDDIVPVALSDQGVAEVMAFIVAILGKLPDLPTASSVQTLVDRLIGVHEYSRALELLERHRHFVKGDIGLCLAQADCHKFRGEAQMELAALQLAYDLDKTRWKTLTRIIWCAQKCALPDVVSWALACLRADFPKHYAALTKNKPWLRQLD